MSQYLRVWNLSREQLFDECERLDRELAELKEKHRWIPLAERMPDYRKPIYMIAIVPERNYVTDQYVGWIDWREWVRWPHKFEPTHWMYQLEGPLPEPKA